MARKRHGPARRARAGRPTDVGADLHRLDFRAKRPQGVETPDEGSNLSDPVLGRHKVVEAQRPEFHLTALCPAQKRLVTADPFRRRPLRQLIAQIRPVTRCQVITSRKSRSCRVRLHRIARTHSRTGESFTGSETLA
jgi:hypothetical protein